MRERIIISASTLFKKYGFKKVNVEDICKEAGISRVTFYKYFKNKIELSLEYLQKLFDENISDYEKIINSEIEFGEKLQKIIELKLKTAGEFSMDFIKELYYSDIPEVKSFFDEQIRLNQIRTIEFIETAKNQNYIKPEIPTNYILYRINNVIKELQDEKLYSFFSNSTELTQTIIDTFFYGIIKNKQ
ncbi:MAG: TetR/AcrR family transcriptional regulator [Bacteroidales bacterium]|jgi:AcrR family transcriptional regulator|nr:TetR/AcrR family transcriptional regulator [Bacteroidales bacterium]HOL98558.1 TetR/AcrR family transcriptional regulator [Bacteroidales bacterium]HOM37154.1 TetR/AcrR family transcriptional regulator [Bacteroidales bacterium]HPD24761.1 TetR/AcrR family transcriptional regulator [Bacteroidales bacterium]HRT00507.1 TetR/AcrR family transcriptional regulator [Bacteroidales bacterium]